MTPAFAETCARHGVDLAPLGVETLQVNITKLCNQACRHCHVDASPVRTEAMDARTLDRVLEVLAAEPGLRTLDITGGAPELHPEFARLVRAARGLGKHVLVRHNLTVQLDPHPRTGESLAHLPAFFAEHRVEVVSSLPYFQAYFTDKQRGRGVFEKSLEAMRRLNAVGYGQGTGLVFDLVHNPVGSFLPAEQAALEARYRAELGKLGVRFDALWTITNMPIHRFKADLERLGTFDEYMGKLVAAFNPAAARGVMCRSLISVGHDGRLYDCDFNQMLELPIGTIFEWDPAALRARTIRTDAHCFGCTAGAGSSCGGATA